MTTEFEQMHAPGAEPFELDGATASRRCLAAAIVAVLAAAAVAIGALLPIATAGNTIVQVSRTAQPLDVVSLLVGSVIVVVGALVVFLAGAPGWSLVTWCVGLLLGSLEVSTTGWWLHRIDATFTGTDSINAAPGVGLYLIGFGVILLLLAVTLLGSGLNAWGPLLGFCFGVVFVILGTIAGNAVAYRVFELPATSDQQAAAPTANLLASNTTLPAVTTTTLVSARASVYVHGYAATVTADDGTKTNISLPYSLAPGSDSIQHGYYTGDGLAESFYVNGVGADASFGSVIYFDRNDSRWELAKFNTTNGLQTAVPFLQVSSDGLSSENNDCNPDCAGGTQTTLQWFFDPTNNYFATGTADKN